MYKEQIALFLTLLFGILVLINIILSTFIKLHFWFGKAMSIDTAFQLGILIISYKILFKNLLKNKIFYLKKTL
jgi:hypothetical protein